MQPLETATQTLHRLTSYEPGRDWDEPVDDPRVLQELVVNDVDRLPWFYKRYEQPLPRVPLPRDLPATTAPAIEVLAGTAHTQDVPLDLAQLSRLLHLSAGVTRTAVRPYATWLFRAAGSAGGRFPLEIYVAVPEGVGLPPGVHWYDPLEHALVQVGPPPPHGGAPTLVVTGVPWRTGWRYRERGFRHVYWDAGTMLAQLLAVADAAGLGARLFTPLPGRVRDRPRRRGRGARVARGRGRPGRRLTRARGDRSGRPRARSMRRRWSSRSSRARSGRATATRSGGRGIVAPPSTLPGRGPKPIDEVVLARGSQRRMDITRGLPEETLRTSMLVAMRGIDVPHRVVVHAVEGLAPGVYRWPDLAAPARAGELRDELYRVCLEQGLASEAAFVVIGATDVGALDDREYREAQLAAGMVEGRLHLAAYSLGAGATGMTFLDSEIHALLGEPLDALLFTCVGVPEYVSAPAARRAPRPSPNGHPPHALALLSSSIVEARCRVTT